MPPNEPLDTPAARGPEVRKSVISAFQLLALSRTARCLPTKH